MGNITLYTLHQPHYFTYKKTNVFLFDKFIFKLEFLKNEFIYICNYSEAKNVHFSFYMI